LRLPNCGANRNHNFLLILLAQIGMHGEAHDVSGGSFRERKASASAPGFGKRGLQM
jgi:hypothetical protein